MFLALCIYFLVIHKDLNETLNVDSYNNTKILSNHLALNIDIEKRR